MREFLNESTSVNIKSSVRALKFHKRKWVTALLRFPCFGNLWDYNLKRESVIKTTIDR